MSEARGGGSADRVKESERAELHRTIWRIANDLRGSVDASAEFTRQGNKNKLTDDHIARVMELYEQRTDEPHHAALVTNDALAENSYNLSVSSYVEAEDTREQVDITALNAEIARIVARQPELRTAIDAVVADIEGGA